jgi:hypothetical protein
LDVAAGVPDSLQAMAEHQALVRLTDLIRQLLPIDRQVILSYLDAEANQRADGSVGIECRNQDSPDQGNTSQAF